eukprot:TRINITY_DN18568_c0_g1_i1.p1 TRINITY_DN18568_c0_g1~~TRINITY_DN18568_c0_g1_i1.p1  ORF type:complete len:575 (+),score=111.11 TRINITY_DN18568_c0_g1_i1:114-1838(+)
MHCFSRRFWYVPPSGCRRKGSISKGIGGQGCKTAPWQLDPLAATSGYCVQTELKESLIPGAGKGRFSLERIEAGTVIRKLRVVDATSPHAFEPGTLTRIRNVEEVEASFGEFLHVAEDGCALENDAKEGKAGGTCGIDATHVPDQCSGDIARRRWCATRASDMCWSADSEAAYFFAPSNWVNHQHGSHANIAAAVDQTGLNASIYATRTISPGEEMYKDYSTFKNPRWFTQYAWREAGQPCTGSLGKLLRPAAEKEGQASDDNTGDASPDVRFSCTASLASQSDALRAAVTRHGYCMLRHTGCSVDDDTLLSFLPHLAKAAKIEDTLAYNAAGGNVPRQLLELPSGISANEVVANTFPPHTVIPPHHELLFTPMKPKYVSFLYLEGSGDTTVFDGLAVLDHLHSAALADWSTRCALLRKVNCDRMVYRRRVVSPGSAEMSFNEGCISWARLFGDVPLEQAVACAQHAGYKVHVESSNALLLDFAHPLVCPETGALNNNTAADRLIFPNENIYWESTGEPISEDDCNILHEAYLRSRVPFSWQRPGDILVLDNRRMAHGRGPCSDLRRILQLLGR